MNRTTDWIERLLPGDTELLEWSVCTPLTPLDDPEFLTLAGTLKFRRVATSVDVVLDLVREEDSRWTVSGIRLPQYREWDENGWHRPERDARASADAKRRLLLVGLLPRLNFYLLEAARLEDPEYVSPLHQDGPLDFTAVDTEELSPALREAVRGI